MNLPRINWLLPRMALLGVIGLLLLGCAGRAESGASESVRGKILLWHALEEAEAAGLDQVIARFHELRPEAQVIVQRFASSSELLQSFEETAQAGLGADIIIGPNAWVRPLAQTGLLADIDERLSPETLQRYVPAALETLRYDGKLFGLPLALNTLALYYNRDLVDGPPRTLEELFQAVDDGSSLLMGVSFQDAYWGIQAFGGRVLDDEGLAVLDQGGFVNWLAYLKSLRDLPATILDSNRDALRERFLEGGVAYYIGATSEYRGIADALGEDRVGVATLPSGPTGSAGPILTVVGLLFNDSSSPGQRDLAVDFAHFLTNAEQSASLMRLAQVVPANAQVRVNARLNPVVASFSAQAATAVAIPSVTEMDAVWRLASDIYSRVLQGVAEPATIAADVTAAINEANGIAPVARAGVLCGPSGELRVGHSLAGAAAQALAAIADLMGRDCPEIQVELVPLAPEDLQNEPSALFAGDGALDLLLAPHTLLPQLIQEGAIRPISNLLQPDQLQRYRSSATTLFRTQGELYGIPESVSTSALYRNTALAPNAARTLDELQGQAAAGQRILLDVNFEPAFWGLAGHGGRLTGDQGEFILDEAAFIDWLAWLVAARDEARIGSSRDATAMRLLFKTFGAPYLVGDPSILGEMRDALGEDLLTVTPLPSGPNGAGQSLLRGDGYVFRNGLVNTDAARAVSFALYATHADRQLLSVQTADRLPANATVDVSAYPLVAQFLEVVNLSQPVPTVPGIEDALHVGDRAYIEVLENGRDPAEVAAAVIAEMNLVLAAAAAGQAGP